MSEHKIQTETLSPAPVGTQHGLGEPSQTQPKFTPGPWKVDPSLADECGADYVGVGSPTWAICRVWTDVAELKSGGIANAHLIAAAPEMYEALRDACALLGWVEPDSAEMRVNLNRIHALGLAALAKAEGRSL